jgi:hypothetical protein
LTTAADEHMDKDDDYRSRSYPIEEDIHFQRRVWRFERFGWVLLLGLTVATLLGLFSEGPLSDRDANQGELSAKYGVFERSGAATRVVLSARGEAGGPVEFVLGSAFMATHAIEAIQPAPGEAATIDGGGLRLMVKADDRGYATAHISVRPHQAGLVRSEFRSGADRLPITQLIYP